ncbi:MAG: hypothetical protein QOI88_893 [Gammaproteobacteria bacterium]|nr:hypothetical protein [Gammaproteobacteria bacterium]
MTVSIRCVPGGNWMQSRNGIDASGMPREVPPQTEPGHRTFYEGQAVRAPALAWQRRVKGVTSTRLPRSRAHTPSPALPLPWGIPPLTSHLADEGNEPRSALSGVNDIDPLGPFFGRPSASAPRAPTCRTMSHTTQPRLSPANTSPESPSCLCWNSCSDFRTILPALVANRRPDRSFPLLRRHSWWVRRNS